MESQNNKSPMQAETTNRQRLMILIELVMVFLPVSVGLYLGEKAGTSYIPLWGDLVILGAPVTYLGLVISLIILLIFTGRRGVTWGSYGVKQPNNWFHTIVKSLGIALAVFLTVKFIINPIMSIIPNAGFQDLSRFNYLKGDVPNLIIMLANIWITAAFLEEFLFRSYLMERLVDLFNSETLLTWIVIIIGQAIFFGLVHAYQSPIGMLKVGLIGLVFGVSYRVSGRNLWPLILAHGLIDSMDMISHFFGG